MAGAVDAEVDVEQQRLQRRRVESVVAVWKRKTFLRAGRKARGGADGEVVVEDDVVGLSTKVWLIDSCSMRTVVGELEVGKRWLLTSIDAGLRSPWWRVTDS